MISNTLQLKPTLIDSDEERKRNRFLLWLIYLNRMDVKNGGEARFQELRELNRLNYEVKKQEAMEELKKMKEKDPLHHDQKITGLHDQIDVIEKDIQRTYQELPLFTEKTLQTIMFDVLLTWSISNHSIAYKQGMNELLGLVILVFLDGHGDLQEAESDLFWAFDRLLLNHKEMFINSTNSPIAQRMKQFLNQQLKLVDLELFKFFKFEEIQVQVFLIRWIRCLYAREFDIEQCKLIWDHMLYDYYVQGSFRFIESYGLAMMTHIREKILYDDCPMNALQYLLRYPCKNDYIHILEKAYNIQVMIEIADSSDGDLQPLRTKTFMTESDHYQHFPVLLMNDQPRDSHIVYPGFRVTFFNQEPPNENQNRHNLRENFCVPSQLLLFSCKKIQRATTSLFSRLKGNHQQTTQSIELKQFPKLFCDGDEVIL